MTKAKADPVPSVGRLAVDGSLDGVVWYTVYLATGTEWPHMRVKVITGDSQPIEMHWHGIPPKKEHGNKGRPNVNKGKKRGAPSR